MSLKTISLVLRKPLKETKCIAFLQEEIQAAVDTAHSVGKRVAAHCYGGVGLRYCVEAGS